MRIFTVGFLLIPFLSLAQQTLPDPLEAGWKGQKVCEVLVDNESVRTLKCTFPPGVGHEKHFHKKHVG